MIDFNIIVAIDFNNGIGKDGSIPWKLHGDMKYFKNVTTGNALNEHNIVIMGRKTWESIPKKFKPLCDRLNFIISRTMSDLDIDGYENTMIFRSIEDGLNWAGSLYKLKKIDRVYVIGGAEIYRETMMMSNCKNIYMTQIYKDFKCDCFFPNIEEEYKFSLKRSSDYVNENGLIYNFKKYKRID
jgi:dihydrofolate reductase